MLLMSYIALKFAKRQPSTLELTGEDLFPCLHADYFRNLAEPVCDVNFVQSWFLSDRIATVIDVIVKQFIDWTENG